MSYRPIALVNGHRQRFAPSVAVPATPASLCIKNGKLYCNHALDATLKQALIDTTNGTLRVLPATDSLDLSPYWCCAWSASTWQVLMNALAAVRYTSPTGAVAFSTFGSLASTNTPYSGAVYCPNTNQIICIPSNATQAAIITMGSAVAFVNGSAGALFPGAGVYGGGMFAYDANIYCIPYANSNVMKITPTGYNTLTTAVYAIPGATAGWTRGCLSCYNGNIYAPPGVSGLTSCLKVGPNGAGAPTISKFGTISTYYYSAGVSASNGKLYFLPNSTTANVLVIDPTNADAIGTIGALTAPIGWVSAIQAPNGYIYGVPGAATTVLKVNPTTGVCSQIAGPLAQHYYQGGVLAPDGKIYCLPGAYDNNQMLVIDTNTDTVSYIAHTASNYFLGGVLCPDGAVYGAPGPYQTNFTRLFLGYSDVPLQICGNTYINKF